MNCAIKLFGDDTKLYTKGNNATECLAVQDVIYSVRVATAVQCTKMLPSS